MGEVYLVQHPRLPRRNALKVLPADVSADADFAMVSIYQFPAWMVPPVPTEAEHELFNAFEQFHRMACGAVAVPAI